MFSRVIVFVALILCGFFVERSNGLGMNLVETITAENLDEAIGMSTWLFVLAVEDSDWWRESKPVFENIARELRKNETKVVQVGLIDIHKEYTAAIRFRYHPRSIPSIHLAPQDFNWFWAFPDYPLTSPPNITEMVPFAHLNLEEGGSPIYKNPDLLVRFAIMMQHAGIDFTIYTLLEKTIIGSAGFLFGLLIGSVIGAYMRNQEVGDPIVEGAGRRIEKLKKRDEEQKKIKKEAAAAAAAAAAKAQAETSDEKNE